MAGGREVEERERMLKGRLWRWEEVGGKREKEGGGESREGVESRGGWRTYRRWRSRGGCGV
jgi:hypothetical protein